MSTCKISYNGNEISSVDEAAPVSVAYNSATIATLNDGDTKTLGCHGKVMASDVVIGGKTLNCNGKLMQGDIVVELVGSATGGETWVLNEKLSSANATYIISFTSNSTRYSRLKISLFARDRLKYDDTLVYGSNRWINQAYRKLTFDAPPTGALLKWLQANGVKQPDDTAVQDTKALTITSNRYI